MFSRLMPVEFLLADKARAHSLINHKYFASPFFQHIFLQHASFGFNIASFL